MTKTEFVTRLMEESGFSKKETEKFLGSYEKVVVDALVNKERIQLVGFGTYETSHRNEKPGFNPKTNEKITIPEADVPKFSFSKNIKDTVNKGK